MAIIRILALTANRHRWGWSWERVLHSVAHDYTLATMGRATRADEPLALQGLLPCKSSTSSWKQQVWRGTKGEGFKEIREDFQIAVLDVYLRCSSPSRAEVYLQKKESSSRRFAGPIAQSQDKS